MGRRIFYSILTLALTTCFVLCLWLVAAAVLLAAQTAG